MATLKEAREFLGQAYEARNNAIVLAYELAEIKQISKNLIASYELAFGGSNQKFDISTEIAKIEEKAGELQKQKDLWLDKMQEIEMFLDRLNLDAKTKKVLSLMYLSCQNAKKISRELCYSERHIRRIHFEGLKKVADNLKDVRKCP